MTPRKIAELPPAVLMIIDLATYAADDDRMTTSQKICAAIDLALHFAIAHPEYVFAAMKQLDDDYVRQGFNDFNAGAEAKTFEEIIHKFPMAIVGDGDEECNT